MKFEIGFPVIFAAFLMPTDFRGGRIKVWNGKIKVIYEWDSTLGIHDNFTKAAETFILANESTYPNAGGRKVHYSNGTDKDNFALSFTIL